MHSPKCVHTIIGLILVCLLAGDDMAQTATAASATPEATHPTCRPGDPVTLDALAYCAAALVARSKDPDDVSAFFDAMAVLAIADALAPKAKEEGSKLKFEFTKVQQETARTDKQLGATARSQGSTSLAEKAGIQDLLGLAIENGAIQKEVSGTTLTLTSSPYALTTLRSGDTATNYQRHGSDLGRIGISATFNLSNQEDVLSNATRRQLAEWSARIRLTGDHSTRSRSFEAFWDKQVKPAIEQQAIVITQAEAMTFRGVAEKKRQEAEDKLRSSVKGYLDQHPDLKGDDATQIALLQAEILAKMKSDVTDSIDSFSLDDVTKQRIVDVTLPGLQRAQVQATEGVQVLNEETGRLERLGTATFEYTNVRDTTAGTYSNLKFLFEKGTSDTMKLVFNAGASFYSSPDRTLNQQTTRDYATAFSWEGKAGRSPFSHDVADNSQTTFSVSGRYQRLLENRHVPGKKADIAVAQGKIEIPLFTGVSVPLSIAYANADELQSKDHVRFNIGLNFDSDKLYQVLQFNKLKPAASP